MNRRSLLELLTAVGLTSVGTITARPSPTHKIQLAMTDLPPKSVATLPEPLQRLIREHGERYAPHYPPDGNADHGPMACLAMHGLGMDVPLVERFAAQYRRRLVVQSHSPEVVTEANWERHVGRRESYSALRKFFASRIDSQGWQATVAEYLPSLISGWVKDAFHPLIRLGYGIEFQVPSEIASGLAYLGITGNDPQLAAIAQREPSPGDARSYLGSLQSSRNELFVGGRFNTRYQLASQVAALRPAAGPSDVVLKDLSRVCLEVFDATHDFFALHLVTSSHAFRICSPWAGPNWGALYGAGIAAAYLAIGAPTFTALSTASAELPLDMLLSDTNEHDIKIAYSSLAQTKAFGDPTYGWVAARYLRA
jgi:hypothetical protein